MKNNIFILLLLSLFMICGNNNKLSDEQKAEILRRQTEARRRGAEAESEPEKLRQERLAREKAKTEAERKRNEAKAEEERLAREKAKAKAEAERKKQEEKEQIQKLSEEDSEKLKPKNKLVIYGKELELIEYAKVMGNIHINVIFGKYGDEKVVVKKVKEEELNKCIKVNENSDLTAKNKR